MVLVNAVLMGIQADVQHGGTYGKSDVNWDAMELVFTVFYIGEIVVKVVAFGHIFFLDGWNLLDVAVVLTTCLAEFTTLIAGNYVSALRLVRFPSEIHPTPIDD